MGFDLLMCKTAATHFLSKADRLPTQGDPLQVGFRGRLTNRRELMSRLTLTEPCSDEVIVKAAFTRWNTACASYLRGAFAFVVATRAPCAPSLIFAARDPSGQEPLFYASTSQGFHAAQSIKDLSSESGLDTLDENRVASWLNRPSIFRTETFFREIHKLPPGHMLIGDGEQLTVSRYWQPENLAPHQVSDPEELWKEYAAILQNSVVRAMGAEKLGSHASGGIDSTAVYRWAQAACRETGQSLTGYSWHSQPPSEESHRENEYDQVEILATQAGNAFQYCPTNVPTLIEVLSQDLTQRPWMLANVMLTERAVQRAAQADGIKTMLSGWGGDEIASQNYGKSYRQHCLQSGQLGPYWQSLTKPRSGRQILRDGLQLLGLRSSHGNRSKPHKETFLHPDWQKRVAEESPFPPRLNPLPLHYWNLGHLAERIEAYADSGRDFGLRYAHPLLDQEVMEFALRIPLALAVNPRITRWPFRQAISGIVPPEITWARAKCEPLRVEATRQITAKALTEIGHALRTKSTQPKRSHFFDMPKLLQALEPADLQQSSHYGRLLRAVSILDF